MSGVATCTDRTGQVVKIAVKSNEAVQAAWKAKEWCYLRCGGSDEALLEQRLDGNKGPRLWTLGLVMPSGWNVLFKK